MLFKGVLYKPNCNYVLTDSLKPLPIQANLKPTLPDQKAFLPWPAYKGTDYSLGLAATKKKKDADRLS